MRWLLILMLCVTTTPLHAQRGRSAPLWPRDSQVPGLRMRLFTAGLPFRYTGSLKSVYGDTIHFESEKKHRVLVIPLSDLKWLQVSTERRLTRARLATAVTTGAIVGFASSRALQFATVDKNGGVGCPPNGLTCVRPLNLWVTAAGAGAGALFAWKHPSDDWRTVRLR